MVRKREAQPHLTETATPDQIEQAGLDSFPASDPPSWIAVHTGRPAAPAPQEAPGTPGRPKADAGAPADRDPAGTPSAPDPRVPGRGPPGRQ